MSPEILRKAAKLVANGEVDRACCALWIQGPVRESQFFSSLFSHNVWPYQKKLGWWNGPVTEENQLTRSLALCLAADILESM